MSLNEYLSIFKKNIMYYFAKLIKKLRGSSIKNSFIPLSSKIESGSNILNVRFGEHSFCGYNCEISNAEVGSFCSIANGVIIGGGMHPMDWVSMSPVFYEGRDSVKRKFSEHKRKTIKRTIIGHDVWIGQNALIKQGVKIGTGAVIGMGSVVTKDIEPYSIVAGVPACEIKKRFSAEIIKELQIIKWWEFSDSDLFEFAKYFNNPLEFIKRFNQKKKIYKG